MFTAMAEGHQSNKNQSCAFSSPISSGDAAGLLGEDDEEIPSEPMGAFAVAGCPDDIIEDIFREAAEGEGEDGGGASWHGWAPIGLPGAKFHAMTGQIEKSHLVRLARKQAKAFRNVVMGRPAYYDDFSKINSFKM